MMWQITENFLVHHTNMKSIDREYNNTHTLDFIGEVLVLNPTILSHGKFMAAIDKVNFKESMNVMQK